MRLLGAADPLRHRRLGHEERARDLRGRQPADGAQRERDRRRRRERGVAAHEEQDERVVVLRSARCSRPRQRRGRSSGRLRHAATVPRGGGARSRCARGRSSAARRRESASRAGCRACPAPATGRGGDQRFLHRVFGRGEVAEAPDDGAEHLRRELAQQVLGRDSRSESRRRSHVVGGGAHHLRAPRSACSAARRRARAPPRPARRSRTRAPAISTSTIQ